MTLDEKIPRVNTADLYDIPKYGCHINFIQLYLDSEPYLRFANRKRSFARPDEILRKFDRSCYDIGDPIIDPSTVILGYWKDGPFIPLQGKRYNIVGIGTAILQEKDNKRTIEIYSIHPRPVGGRESFTHFQQIKEHLSKRYQLDLTRVEKLKS